MTRMRNPGARFALVALVAMLQPACDQADLTGPPPVRLSPWDMAASVVPPGVTPCGVPVEVNLLAGKNTVVGSVGIANDDTNLYVTYVTTGGWTVDVTHLDVALSIGDTPLNPAGNPTIGKFTYSGSHPGATIRTYTIPLADLGAGPDDPIIVAAHAEVSHLTLGTQGAWAEGTPFTEGGNWATWAGYTVQGCVADPGVVGPAEFCINYAGTATIEFEDANLEAAVRSALALLPAEDLTCDLAATLRQLTANNAGIASLAGIQNLTGLTILTLVWNDIQDLGPLATMTSLTGLDLYRNPISDITPLAGLTNLISVGLGDLLTPIALSDISPLASLVNLLWVSAAGTAISDIGPLSGLTELRTLILDKSQIQDISPVSGLVNLRVLQARDNQIVDLTPVTGLPSLATLAVGLNPISDLSPLTGNTSLQTIGLESTAIDNADLTVLGGLTGILRLNIDANGLTDIASLAPLVGLLRLSAAANDLTAVGAVQGMVALQILSLQGNLNLSNIQPIIDNSGIGSGDTVYLWDTAVSCTDIATLAAKGPLVHSNCT